MKVAAAYGPLIQWLEISAHNRAALGSSPRGSTMQVSYNGNTSAFQAEAVGSIPITCSKEKNGGAFMRANLDRAKAMQIAAKEGLEWEVQNTFKNLKKQFGKKVADSMLWSMALDEWEL